MDIKGTIVRRIGAISKRFSYAGTRLEWKGFLSIFSFVVKDFDRRMDLMDRGHAVVIMPVDFAAREVCMIEQPRYAKAYADSPAAMRALERARDAGPGVEDQEEFTLDADDVTVLEMPAGMIDKGETPIGAAIRELREETGFVVRADQMVEVGTYFPSLGGSTERLTAFLVRLELDQPTVEPDGDGSERINVWRLPFEEAWRQLDGGKIRTASSNILLRELKIVDLEGRK